MQDNNIDSALIELIRKVKQDKINNKQVPNHVMINELMEEVKSHLRELIKKGSIKVGNTINSVYFDIE